MDIKSLLNSATQIAKDAGHEILKFYHGAKAIAVNLKSDQSPLTEADLVANQLIIAKLKQLTPSLPILSEESAPITFAERKKWQQYWLIDPIDGTKEFINKTNEFTVNIALIADHKPILGIVHAPALQHCYFAAAGIGAFKQENNFPAQQITTRPYNHKKIVVTASRRHGHGQLENFLAQLGSYTIVQRGSALKCGLVAEGVADIYPRFGPTSEWDIAAGQCVLEQAGGKIIDFSGKPLRYNTKESLENPPFLAVGDVNQDWLSYLQ